MEGAGHRGRWNKEAPVGTARLLLLMCTLTMALSEPSEERQCLSHEYLSSSGVCCNKCIPGSKLTGECLFEGQRSNCTECPDDQYMENSNYFPNCKSCRRCSKWNEYEVEPCQKTRNTICKCKVGHYKFEITEDTYECRRCKQCGADEKEQEKCTPEKNTVCVCKDDYYKVKNKCEPCENCTSECTHLCLHLSTEGPGPGNERHIHIIAGIASASVVLLVLGVIVTHTVTKWVIKKKLTKQSTHSSDVSQDSCQVVLIEEQPLDKSVKAIPQTQSLVIEPQLPNLPDCVPLEIKIPELIYTVLDLVPVHQVKQLVRTLGVTDTEIEQAQMDHKSCREAHYQMLRGWAERGSGRMGGGGRGGMLHCSLMQDLLDKLRKMHLGRAAEELETFHGIQ